MQIEDTSEREMNQSSPRTTTADQNESLFLKDIGIDMEKVPDYLTKRNPAFQQMVNRVVETLKLNDKDNMEDLRTIAVLIYKTKLVQLYQDLWTYYLKAGVGQLSIQPSKPTLVYPTNISIWPKEIQTMAQTAMKINEENKQGCYLNFVRRYLQVLEEQFEKYQSELKIKVNRFQSTSSSSRIQQQMETYIEENFDSFRKEIEHKVELIHYDYHIRALRVEYFRYQPNESQVCI